MYWIKRELVKTTCHLIRTIKWAFIGTVGFVGIMMVWAVIRAIILM